MAIMVTTTLDMDEATYQGLHDQLLTMARAAGMLFHSGRVEGDRIAVVDFGPSEEAWQSFAEGPMAERMKAAGIAPPDDLTVTPRARRGRRVGIVNGAPRARGGRRRRRARAPPR